jgi:hypothetical protein
VYISGNGSHSGTAQATLGQTFKERQTIDSRISRYLTNARKNTSKSERIPRTARRSAYGPRIAKALAEERISVKMSRWPFKDSVFGRLHGSN